MSTTESFGFNLEEIVARCAIGSFILRDGDKVEYISSNDQVLFSLAALVSERFVYQLIKGQDGKPFLQQVQQERISS